jgi:predicted RNase H-like HicB family nuclease
MRTKLQGFDTHAFPRHTLTMKSEIIFEVTEAEEGGYCASDLGFGINTQADSLEDLRTMVRDAVDCYFDDPVQAPGIIRLHFVRDEVLAR